MIIFKNRNKKRAQEKTKMKTIHKKIPKNSKGLMFPTQLAISMCIFDLPKEMGPFPVLVFVAHDAQGKKFGLVMCDGNFNRMQQIATTNWNFKNHKEAKYWYDCTVKDFESRGFSVIKSFANDTFLRNARAENLEERGANSIQQAECETASCP